MGVSKNRETPWNGWFVMENPIKKWMIWGDIPLFSETSKNQHQHQPTYTNLHPPLSILTCGWLFEYRLDDLRLRDGRRPVGEAGAGRTASTTGTSGGWRGNRNEDWKNDQPKCAIWNSGFPSKLEGAVQRVLLEISWRVCFCGFEGESTIECFFCIQVCKVGKGEAVMATKWLLGWGFLFAKVWEE